VQVWLQQMEILGGVASTIGGTPWVFSERASAAAYPFNLKTVARRLIATKARAIVANSAAGDAYWRAHAPRVSRYVIPNGLPLAEIAAAPVADDIGLDGSGPLVLFAGRFDPQKNIMTLLDSLRLVRERVPVRAVLCGDGSLRNDVEQWIERHAAASWIRVMGYVPNLWGMMKQAAVMVSPSHFEGNPNVVLEAMAAGCPIVVSNLPEHREIVDDSCTVFVDQDSAADIARAIEAVLGDPAGAASRARAATRRLAELDIVTIAARYMGMYRDVIASGKAV
jgi:glycosyltransferase involved in cell wall biosynthesis